jgi:hypothetical protein
LVSTTPASSPANPLTTTTLITTQQPLHKQQTIRATSSGGSGAANVEDTDTASGSDGSGDAESEANRRQSKVGSERGKLQRLVESSWFVTAIMICIALNTVAMAAWFPKIDEPAERVLTALNYIFTAAFLAEMVAKMVAYGLWGYFVYKVTERDSQYRSSRWWNRFDCVVVVVSVVEVILVLSSGSSLGGLSVLRTLRLLRVLKLAANWKTMNRLISTIVAGDSYSLVC